jgi:hypothetical protein
MGHEFSKQIFKKTQISSFIKILLLGAELFHADGQTERQTDMTKLILAFRNFANARNKKSVAQLIFLQQVCLENLHIHSIGKSSYTADEVQVS